MLRGRKHPGETASNWPSWTVPGVAHRPENPSHHEVPHRGVSSSGRHPTATAAAETTGATTVATTPNGESNCATGSFTQFFRLVILPPTPTPVPVLQAVLYKPLSSSFVAPPEANTWLGERPLSNPKRTTTHLPKTQVIGRHDDVSGIRALPPHPPPQRFPNRSPSPSPSQGFSVRSEVMSWSAPPPIPKRCAERGGGGAFGKGATKPPPPV